MIKPRHGDFCPFSALRILALLVFKMLEFLIQEL
jgi:hypothetical protein